MQINKICSNIQKQVIVMIISISQTNEKRRYSNTQASRPT